MFRIVRNGRMMAVKKELSDSIIIGKVLEMVNTNGQFREDSVVKFQLQTHYTSDVYPKDYIGKTRTFKNLKV
jgi:hypothetical protein